jgi:hypothetical protein
VLDQVRQHGRQALVETRDFVRGEVFKLTDVQPGFDDRAVRPNIGSAQVCYTEKFYVFLLCHVFALVSPAGYTPRKLAALFFITSNDV